MSFLDLIILIPELFFSTFILVILWAGLYLRFKSTRLSSSALSPYSAFLIITVLTLYTNSFFETAVVLSKVFSISQLDFFLKEFILVVSLIVILTISKQEKHLALTWVDVEVTLIKLTIVFATLLLVSVNDLIYIFFILELYSLAAYVLVGYRGRTSVFSGEAALKYFLLGTVFSIIMCYSIAVLYLITGLTNLEALQLYVNLTPDSAFAWRGYDLLHISVTLLLVSFLFKLAAAPFHFWAPDVYEGSPTSTMYFLSVVPKIALLAILIKLSFLWQINSAPSSFLLVCAILSFLVGSVGGLFQKKIKRLLTYSMINNNGFFILALALTSFYSVTLMLFFLAVYTITLLGLFTSLQNMRLYSTLVSIRNLWAWSGLFFIDRARSLCLGLFLFSSAGIPPLVGFLAKFLILFGLLSNFSNLHYLIVVVLILAPLSCFYYIRIVKNMSFTKKRVWLFMQPLPGFAAYTLSAGIVSLVLLFIASGSLLNILFVLYL